MKILCVTYRDWAIELYDIIESKLDSHIFKRINSRKEYHKFDVDEFSPDIILFYGWSWIIKDEILTKYDCFMLHPSKLPEFRGGSPIQNQIIRGVKNSAVTIFKMDSGVDTGDIVYQENLNLSVSLNEIFQSMTKIGSKGTIHLIENYQNIKYIKQDNSKSSYYKRRKKHESEITLKELQEKPSNYIIDKIRMLDDPYPNAYIKLSDGKKLLIKKAVLE